jgi:hypothetical protein
MNEPRSSRNYRFAKILKSRSETRKPFSKTLLLAPNLQTNKKKNKIGTTTINSCRSPRTRLISPPGQNENVPLFNLLFSVIPISPEFGKKTPFNPSLAAPIRSPHAIYLSRRVSDQIGFR